MFRIMFEVKFIKVTQVVERCCQDFVEEFLKKYTLLPFHLLISLKILNVI